ncbi:MAG: hypothetical protein ACRDCN_13075 [Tannerellaceae bacterium]
MIVDKLGIHEETSFNVDLDRIIQTIGAHATIHDELSLRRDLLKLVYRFEEKELYQIMLNELLNEKRIVKIKNISDWKSAIAFAAKPLIEDGSIEPAYI